MASPPLDRKKVADLVRNDDRQRYSGREYADAYDAGVADGKGSPIAKKVDKATRKKPAPTKRTASSSSSSRKAQAKRGARKARSAGRTAAAAGAGRSGSFVGLLVLSLGLVLLYNFLQGAAQLAGFLGGIQKALAWLVSPTAVIPFKAER